jgi:hypothetical protein
MGQLMSGEFPTTNFDLRLGNHCNLKCRSCGPRDSSGWYDDYPKLMMAGSLFRKVPPVIDSRYHFVKTKQDTGL